MFKAILNFVGAAVLFVYAIVVATTDYQTPWLLVTSLFLHAGMSGVNYGLDELLKLKEEFEESDNVDRAS